MKEVHTTRTSENNQTIPRIIIFDLHETLALFTIDYRKMRAKLSTDLGENFDRIMEKINNLDGDRKKQALAILEASEMESLRDLKLIQYADKVLEKAKQKNYQICLVTLQGRSTVQRILASLNIDTFDYIVTRDELTDRKEQISSCINHFKADPKGVIVIGDKENDYSSANSLGCKAYLVKKVSSIPYLGLDELVDIL